MILKDGMYCDGCLGDAEKIKPATSTRITFSYMDYSGSVGVRVEKSVDLSYACWQRIQAALLEEGVVV